MKELNFQAITERLKEISLPPFEVVVGIADGGIVLASLIAYKLGCDLRMVRFNYRGKDNIPQHPEPVLLSETDLHEIKNANVLLVDDVSISGKTLESAKKLLNSCNIKTMVLRGRADYVLFPELDECVKWPWSA